MPYDGSSVYTLPSSTAAVSGQAIASAKFNSITNDIAASLNDLRIANLNVAADMLSFLGAANDSAARTALGVAVGSDVQAYDAGLASIAGLTTAADKMIYTTASDTYAVADLTAAGRALLDDANAAAQLTTLGLTANGSSLVTAANYAAMRTLLDLEAGTDFYSISAADAAFQPLDSDLTAIAALTTTAAGLTMLTLADPAADKLAFWDDSATSMAFLTLGTGLSITDTTINATPGPTLLGTMTTTSGSAQTLTSLTLTPYKFLRYVINNVSHNSGSSQTLTIGGDQASPSDNAGAAWRGIVDIDLTTGIGVALVGDGAGAQDNMYILTTGWTTSTTEIDITVTGGSFDNGSVKVYGF